MKTMKISKSVLAEAVDQLYKMPETQQAEVVQLISMLKAGALVPPRRRKGKGLDPRIADQMQKAINELCETVEEE